MKDNNRKDDALSATDELLIRLIARKDQAALSMFYDNRSKLVYSIALNILRRQSDAEEVTEDVFLRVWQKAENYDRSKGSVLAWLVTITRRMAIDRTRSKQYKQKDKEVLISNGYSEMDNSPDRLGDTGDLSTSVEVEEIQKALGQLDDTHRKLIMMSYYDGIPHSQISEELNMPLGTVKSRIRSAVNQLRQILEIEV